MIDDPEGEMGIRAGVPVGSASRGRWSERVVTTTFALRKILSDHERRKVAVGVQYGISSLALNALALNESLAKGTGPIYSLVRYLKILQLHPPISPFYKCLHPQGSFYWWRTHLTVLLSPGWPISLVLTRTNTTVETGASSF